MAQVVSQAICARRPRVGSAATWIAACEKASRSPTKPLENAIAMAIIDSLKKISDAVWELPATYRENMRVPARIIATEKLAREMETYSNRFPTTRLLGYQTEQKLTAVLALDFPTLSSRQVIERRTENRQENSATLQPSHPNSSRWRKLEREKSSHESFAGGCCRSRQSLPPASSPGHKRSECQLNRRRACIACRPSAFRRTHLFAARSCRLAPE